MQVFARMKYFLERVIPTAEEWKVQLACHLCVRTPPAAVAPVRRHGGAVCRDDPPAPVLRGVERWDFVTGAERPVFEGLKRFCELVDSPYHGAATATAPRRSCRGRLRCRAVAA